MVRNRLLTLGLHFLHEVVQEEVDQDGIDLDVWMVPFDLSSDQLNAPDTAGCIVLFVRRSCVQRDRNRQELTSQLHFPLAPTPNNGLFLNRRAQRRTVRDAAQGTQDLRDPVVGKHGDFVNVPERTKTLTLEASPQIGNEDLGPLEETDGFLSLAALKGELVAEAGKILCEQVDEPGGGAFGSGYAVGEAAGVFL